MYVRSRQENSRTKHFGHRGYNCQGPSQLKYPFNWSFVYYVQLAALTLCLRISTPTMSLYNNIIINIHWTPLLTLLTYCIQRISLLSSIQWHIIAIQWTSLLLCPSGKQTEQRHWRNTGRKWQWFHGTSQDAPSCNLLPPLRLSWCFGPTSPTRTQLCACVTMHWGLVTGTSPTSWWTCSQVEQLGSTLGMHLALPHRWAAVTALLSDEESQPELCKQAPCTILILAQSSPTLTECVM